MPRTTSHRRLAGLALAAASLLALPAGADALPGKAKVDRNDLRANVVKSFNIGARQVKTADLATAGVTRAKLALGSVGSDQVEDESLTGADVKNNSLTGADVNEATLDGFMASRVRYVFKQANPVPGGAGGFPSSVEADCPAGERAIGGGAAWIIPGFQDGNVPTALHVMITASMPKPANPGTGDATGWHASGRNFSGTNRALRVYAICVPKA